MEEKEIVLQSYEQHSRSFITMAAPTKKRLIVQVYELPEDEERYCQHLQPKRNEITGLVYQAEKCFATGGEWKRDVDENGKPVGEKFEVGVYTCPCCNLPTCDIRHISERRITVPDSHDMMALGIPLCNICAELPMEMIEQIIAFRKSLE